MSSGVTFPVTIKPTEDLMRKWFSVRTLVVIAAAAGLLASPGVQAQVNYSIERDWYNYGDPDYLVGVTFRGCDGHTTSWGVVGDYMVVTKTPCS